MFKQDMGALIQTNQAKQVIHKYKYEQELSNWLLEIKSEAFIEIKGQKNEGGNGIDDSASEDQTEEDQAS